ncbi:type VI secretion system baseplate subunit TssG [Stigmatella hybrida]|uniref:type VI secretion system baseplate subunit TssG n=1 Tax=Stigmatella hybrida TaxID=394097 RepID=UPI001CDB4533|nr:type VI secretion system baseplate subunit TssG [Stigmatella hybrida]
MEQSVEARIRERIRSFDIPALLEVLRASGYGGAEIEYRSHRTTLHQAHLVHDIQFHRQPRPRIIITVNVGLLSAQSPLPSFLMRTMDQLDHERLERFVGFFDHRLLQDCFAGLHPEREGALLPGWPETARDRLRLLRPTCPSTLHWLFSKSFPEAELSVRRETRKQRLPARAMRLGASALGEGDTMGGFASVATGGMEVRVHCNEPLSSSGVPWAVEARRRFESEVLPLLSDKMLMLTVILVLRDQEGFLRIERDSHLGYDPLKGVPAQAQHVLLFSGDTAGSQAGNAMRPS